MAKNRSYYGKSKKVTPRLAVLYAGVVLVIFAAVYKIYSQYGSKSVELEIVTPQGDRVAEKVILSQPEPVAPAPEPVAVPAVVQSATAQESLAQPVVVDAQPEPIAQPVSYLPQYAQAMEKYNDGLVAMDSGNVIQARDLLSEAVNDGLPLATEKEALSRLNDLAKLWLFSRNVYEGDIHSQKYKVQSGDYLSTIGAKFSTPYQFIMRLNGISRAENLRAGETLKVVNGPFRAVADRTKFTLTVYLGDTIAYTWPISTGREGRSTPTGVWEVTKGKKLINPEWTDPDTGKTFMPDDPDNPLGERWIAIHGIEGDAVGRTGFGIHGTIEPDKIGQSASRGCIRLRNQDVEVVYDMLMEGKSHVVIKD